MAVEQFENNYSTLLNGAINNSVTTITVDAAPDNMTGQFRIRIDDEIIIVGTVSGLDFTGCTRGAEGTTAASHLDNAPVTHVLTAGALRFVGTSGGGQEDVFAHGNTGATETFNVADGNIHTATLDANCTITLTNPVNGKGCSITLILTQDGTGGRTVTWPGSVTWDGGVAPVLSTDANDVNIITLFTIDGGTIWYGFLPFDAASESWEGAWAAGTYTEGQIVEHNDVVYQANTTTADEPPGADWTVLYTAPSGGSGYIDAISAETNIQHYWPLNEAHGSTTFADVIGTDDLTITVGSAGAGGPSITGDINGGSVILRAGQGRISRSPFTWGSAWSIEVWAFIGESANDVWLVGQWSTSGAMVYLGSGAGNVRLYSGGTFVTWAGGSSNIIGKHHIVITHDGTTERLWWDGVNVVSQTVANPGTNVGTLFGVAIGGGGGCGVSFSDLARYTVALDTTVINDHYTLGA